MLMMMRFFFFASLIQPDYISYATKYQRYLTIMVNKSKIFKIINHPVLSFIIPIDQY